MQILITIFSIILLALPNDKNAPCISSPSATGVIFQSSDNGQTWQDVSFGLPVDITAFNVHADQHNIYLASNSGLYQSPVLPSDQMWKRQDFLPKDIIGMCSGMSGAYVNSYQKGWFQPLNFSGLWIQVYPAIKNKFVYTIYESSDELVFAGNDRGILKSSDGGNSWSEVYVSDAIWNISEIDGVMIAGGSEGLIRSTDRGETWENVYTNHGSIRKISLNQGMFAAITNVTGKPKNVNLDPQTRNSKLVISLDKGKTWVRMDENLHLNTVVCNTGENASSVRSIKDLEVIGNNIFCSLDTGIYRSADEGKTWKLLLKTDDEKFYNISISGNMIFALKIIDGC